MKYFQTFNIFTKQNLIISKFNLTNNNATKSSLKYFRVSDIKV